MHSVFIVPSVQTTLLVATMAFLQLSSAIAILVIGILALAIDPNVIKVKPGVVIGEQRSSRDGNIGIVKGVRSCGGSAQVLEWRYGSCLESDDICHIPANDVVRTSQVDFIPSHDIKKPALRLVVKSNDGKVNSVLDDGSVIANEGVKKGTTYTVTAIGGVQEELKGKDAIFHYIVYDLYTNDIVFCAEADFQYV